MLTRSLARAAGPEGVLSKDSRGHSVLLLSNGDQESLSSLLFSACGKFRRPEIQRFAFQAGVRCRRAAGAMAGMARAHSRTAHASDEHGKPEGSSRHGWPRNSHYDQDPQAASLCWSPLDQQRIDLQSHPKDTPSTEAASRLMQAAEATSDAFGSDNPVLAAGFRKSTSPTASSYSARSKALLAASAAVNDIQRFTSDENHLKAYLSKLEVAITPEAGDGKPAIPNTSVAQPKGLLPVRVGAA